MDDKKLLFIVNPRAGKTKSLAPLFDAAAIYSEAGYLVSVRKTTHRGEATELAESLGPEFDVVVCHGGDGTLNEVVRQLYGEHTVTRFRPHHFPFTEPSCEMDIQCHKCHGAGCPTCKGEGWIEVLGAGMIHPKVLEGCGIDSTVYSGWAFGMGLERLALGHFKISDLRLIFENDVRFLEQF